MFTAACPLDVLVELPPEVVLELRAKVRRVEEDRMCELPL